MPDKMDGMSFDVDRANMEKLRAVLLPHLLPCRQHTLMDTVLLCEALAGDGLAFTNEQNVHSAVPDITEHVYPAEVPQSVRHSGKPLRVYLRPGKLHMEVLAPVGEICTGFLEKIRLEAVSLFTDPGEGQSGGNIGS